MKNKFYAFLFFFLIPLATQAQTPPLNVYVNPTWASVDTGADPDMTGPAVAMGVDSFSSISEAVTAVAAGGTVHVSEGVFTEQITINKALTLQGAGSGTIIQSPSLLSTAFNTGVPNKPIIFVHNTNTVTISSLVIDGLNLGNMNYRFMGIAYINAGGTIDHVEIRNIQETPLSGNQHGIAIYARTLDTTDRTLNITNNIIRDYQKNGMALVGAALHTSVRDNMVTGSGATTAIAQNGIQLSYGAHGTIQNNTVRNNDCISEAGYCTLDPATSTDSDTAAGILIFSPGDSTIDISNNNLQNNQCNLCAVSYSYYTAASQMLLNIHDNVINGGSLGIGLFDPDGTIPLEASILQNSIINQTYGLFVRDDTPGATAPSIIAHRNQIIDNTRFGAWSNTSVNAENNWWGCAEGPSLTPGICNPHTAQVDTDPWYHNPSGTSAPPPDDIVYTNVTLADDISPIPAGITGWFTARIDVGGYRRNVRMYRPNTNPNLPLLLIYSGTGGLPIDNFLQELGNYRPDYENLIATTLNTYETAIMAFPEPRYIPYGDWDRPWDAAYWETQSFDTDGHEIADNAQINPDLLLTRAIIQLSRSNYAINSERVYSMGFSSGGFFSSLVGTLLSDRVAAFSEQSGGWVQCPRKQYWTPTSHATNWLTLFNEGNLWSSSLTSCGFGHGEPFTTLPPRPLKAYLRHGNSDDVVSVYYTVAEAKLFDDAGQVVTTYAPGLDYTLPANDVVVEIINGKGHDVAIDYLNQAWPFLRSKTLSGYSVTGSGGVIGTGGTSGSGGLSGTGGTTASGGDSGTGGLTASGGTTGSGGIIGTGGDVGTGGLTASGGASGTGGLIGSGGITASGGTTASGGSSGTGGVVGTGGSVGSEYISRGLPTPTADTIAYSGTFADSTGWMTPTLTLTSISRPALASGDRLRVYRPTSRRTGLPLILIFPGTGSDTANFIDEIAGNPTGLINAFSPDEVVIAVAPHAHQPDGDWDHPWDADYWNTSIDNINTNPDLAYIRAIIQEARRAYGIDPRRVYTVGHSSGGFFSEYVAEMLGDRVAGFAENAGGLVGCLAGGKKAPDPQYRSSSTSCDTILTNISGFSGRNNYTCSSTWEPFPTFYPGTPIPAYISHANNDDAVSVYHSCFLRQQLINAGAVEGINLWTNIRNDGSGHAVGSGFLSTAWSRLKNFSL